MGRGETNPPSQILLFLSLYLAGAEHFIYAENKVTTSETLTQLTLFLRKQTCLYVTL